MKAIGETFLELIEGIGSLSKSLPWGVYIVWAYVRLSDPIRNTKTDIDGARLQLTARMQFTINPILVILGGLYQGLQGLATSLIASQISTLVAVMRLTWDEKEQVWRLNTLDALFLACFIPLILMSASGRETERSPIV